MCTQVVMAGSQSSSLSVDVKVKLRYVLATITFNMFLVAITLMSHSDLQPSDSVGVVHCFDGGLINMWHLQSKIKTSSEFISSLQYADDADFSRLTADGLQRSINEI